MTHAHRERAMNINVQSYDQSTDSFCVEIDHCPFGVCISEDGESIAINSPTRVVDDCFTMEEECEILNACKSYFMTQVELGLALDHDDLDDQQDYCSCGAEHH